MSVTLEDAHQGLLLKVELSGEVSATETRKLTQCIRSRLVDGPARALLTNARQYKTIGTAALNGDLIEDFLLSMPPHLTLAFVRPMDWDENFRTALRHRIEDLPVIPVVFDNADEAQAWVTERLDLAS